MKHPGGEMKPGNPLTVVDEAGCLVRDGARLAPFGDVGDAAVRRVAGELRAVHPTATAALNKAAHVSEIKELYGRLDPGDAASVGAHGTYWPTARLMG